MHHAAPCLVRGWQILLASLLASVFCFVDWDGAVQFVRQGKQKRLMPHLVLFQSVFKDV